MINKGGRKNIKRSMEKKREKEKRHEKREEKSKEEKEKGKRDIDNKRKNSIKKVHRDPFFRGLGVKASRGEERFT